MQGKVTMRDIAEALGVSINTVSLVLNDKAGVGEEMRMQVLRKAEELGYLEQNQRYNKAYSSKNICVLIRKIYFMDMHFYSKVLYGVEKAANQNGYDVLVNFADEGEDVPACIASKKVAGVIIIGAVDEARVSAILACNIPVVFVDHTPYDQPMDSVLTDNRIGGFKAVDYLIQNGFDRIGFFGDLDYSHSVKERYYGYTEAVRRLPGLSSMADVFAYTTRYSLLDDIEQHVLDGNTEAIATRLREIPQLPQAYFCSNDRAALLLCNALRTLGLSLPGDVAVVGFDDMDLCTMVMPKLTTMHVATRRMGMKATELLLWRLQNSKAPVEKVLMPVEIVVRDSVATPPLEKAPE